MFQSATEKFKDAAVWSYISVKIQFSNSECKHAIRNAECQSMNPEMSFREVRIQSGNAESIPECNLSVEKASQSCDSSIHQVKRARQKVKTEFGMLMHCGC